MLAYCGRPPTASFGDRYSYIVPRYARVTIAETCSRGVALVTAIISQTGSNLQFTAQLRPPGTMRITIRPSPHIRPRIQVDRRPRGVIGETAEQERYRRGDVVWL